MRPVRDRTWRMKVSSPRSRAYSVTRSLVVRQNALGHPKHPTLFLSPTTNAINRRSSLSFFLNHRQFNPAAPPFSPSSTTCSTPCSARSQELLNPPGAPPGAAAPPQQKTWPPFHPHLPFTQKLFSPVTGPRTLSTLRSELSLRKLSFLSIPLGPQTGS